MTDDKLLIISQKKLALILGGLAIALPTILYLGNLYVFGEKETLSSLSSYYHSPMRDIFVGSLFVLGFFLISYEGYNPYERFFATIAGCLALVIALFPTPETGSETDIIGTIHLLAAGMFYFMLFIFCFFQFTKTNPESNMTFRKKVRNVIYRVCGLTMLAALILLVVTELEYFTLPLKHSGFWLEYVANTAFGTAWLVKGEGVFILNDDPILEMNPWEILGFAILVILALGSSIMLTNIFFI